MSAPSPPRLDDAEKGTVDHDIPFPMAAILKPTSPNQHTTTVMRYEAQLDSVPMKEVNSAAVSSPPHPANKPTAPPKPVPKRYQSKASRWIRFQLWFNTYR